MKLQHSIRYALACVLAMTSVSGASFSTLHAAAETVPPEAIGSVTIGSKTTFYYDSSTSGGATAMWNEAVDAGTATVTLYADWTSTGGTYLVREGRGAAFDGVICVPSGCEITVDLNGQKIDRALVAAIDEGEVIYIAEGAVLNLTDTSSAAGVTGAITGGNNMNGAGGIQVEAGGALNMWGGSITGNVTQGSGGGVLLAGDESLLYMTGGTINENHAAVSGGGVAVVDGMLRVVSGDISSNTADTSGGGIYVQGGTTELSDCTVNSNHSFAGGGICTNAEAVLSLKSSTIVQKNTVGDTERFGLGGGIMAMSARPIQLSGAPLVTMNSNAEGKQSNLVFWVDSERIYDSGRLEDKGLTADSRISISFVDGEERDYVFASDWKGVDVFTPDTIDFTIYEQEGDLYLRRPAELPSTSTLIVIGCVIAAVISLIAVLIIRNQDKKRRKRKRKKKKAAN